MKDPVLDLLKPSLVLRRRDDELLSLRLEVRALFRDDDATVATVGAAVTFNGVDTGETVAEVLSDSIVRLSGALIVSDGDFIGFGFTGAPITTTRVQVADTTGIE